MKTKQINIPRLFPVIMILLFVATISSCRKKEDTIAIIQVLDSSSQKVAGASVTLKGESTTTPQKPVALMRSITTNSEGEAHFNFNDTYQLGQAGVAVLNIEVEKDGNISKGIIKVEQETTSRETVFL